MDHFPFSAWFDGKRTAEADVMPGSERTKLTGTREERILQILRMAGWYEGRCVDISNVERYYQEQKVSMTPPAKDFFREYLGIANAWFITWGAKAKGGGRPTYGPDFQFDLYTYDDIDDVSEFVFDVHGEGYPVRTFEQLLIDKTSGELTTLVGEIGYYYPARVWIGESGVFYTLHEYDHGEVHSYRTFIDFLKWETSKLKLDSAEVFHT